jgi:hypothetical protein
MLSGISNPRTLVIPKEIQMRAYQRAQSHCQFPDCSDRLNLEIIHINGNRENNDLNNLIVLCVKHRREAHMIPRQQLINWAKNLVFANRKSRQR